MFSERPFLKNFVHEKTPFRALSDFFLTEYIIIFLKGQYVMRKKTKISDSLYIMYTELKKSAAKCSVLSLFQV